ncbi:exosome complex exonuclease Rrp41 [Candidatus Parvarchaeota archaeon]|jgi:exosome complex component RRP41|nr:exosome complex exonuclease Rrp41 [Candidatus Acidifodinimicrobium mancum]MBE5729631.1 exosome complex exonuclease Rrp41 [Candidatus Acidifodinimicrobium mancum]MBE5729812.1 exosome complex exonuclease Rrp41 [Candidatus Acidifodinimicrobium mancum]
MYEERLDKRQFDELRPIELETGVVPNANGSARFKIGGTEAIAAVYGPAEVKPKHLEKSDQGIIICKYDMMPFSVPDRAKPGIDRRDMEISLVISNALSRAIMLEEFPSSMISVYVYITQADAGTRCASLTAASMACADAGLPMRDLIAAVAVGKIGDSIVADLSKAEEDYEGGATDIPIAFLPSKDEIVLLQLDGEVSKDELKKAIELGRKEANKIYELEKAALKRRFTYESKD